MGKMLSAAHRLATKMVAGCARRDVREQLEQSLQRWGAEFEAIILSYEYAV
jgi:hypothetical protein